MKIWIIADTHFYHENIKKYQGRLDNFNEQIIKNWNRLVKYNDVVIHLGDVIFGLNKEEQLPSLMATLPGKKILGKSVQTGKNRHGVKGEMLHSQPKG